MREKLYELIRDCDCGCSGCDGCKYEADEAECISHMAYQMTDHLIANGVSLRPKGEWIEHDCFICNSNGEPVVKTGTVFVCSECGREEHFKEPFCHCGADMRGETHDS